MEETLISPSRQDRSQRQGRFRCQQEPCRGETWMNDASAPVPLPQHKAIGPVSILRQRAGSDLLFRRTRGHVREDASDLSILWFVKYGRIVFSNTRGRKVILPGNVAITRSVTPFTVECQVDAESVHEALHVVVPTHVLRGHLRQEFGADLMVASPQAELAIAENILTDLCEDPGEMTGEAAQLLVDTALALIGTAVRKVEGPGRRTVIERRQEELLRYIEVHLSNPQLSPAMAARGCGISPRYLSTLLQLKGTSFSELVWKQRLDKARQFLASEDLRETSIAEIAYGLGFKSPAHFSRMFKRVFQINPRDFRNASADSALAEFAGCRSIALGAGGSDLLQ